MRTELWPGARCRCAPPGHARLSSVGAASLEHRAPAIPPRLAGLPPALLRHVILTACRRAIQWRSPASDRWRRGKAEISANARGSPGPGPVLCDLDHAAPD